MSRLSLMIAIQTAEASGFVHFAAALRQVLAAELRPVADSQERESCAWSHSTGQVQFTVWPPINSEAAQFVARKFAQAYLNRPFGIHRRLVS